VSSGSPTSSESRQRLREALIEPAHAATLSAHGTTRAAVLVPLLDLGGRVHVVLTRRRSDMRRHAGEISFPGGRCDPEDPTPTATALREAHEEVGLPAASVEVLGALPPTGTIVTGYVVYPIVGWIERPAAWVPSPREVDAVLELDLGALLAGYERRRLIRRGIPFQTDAYVVDEHLVWGATARMLGDLFERMPPEMLTPP
jgi:8-oxo-dGTP pyrophosphatase MutT (NUDIX family)